MSQGNYTVLFYVSLGCALYTSSAFSLVIGVGFLIIAAIYLVGGDIVKELRKNNESGCKSN